MAPTESQPTQPGPTLPTPPLPAPTLPTPTLPATPKLPSHARVVVVGGGIIGTSVAYHLGHMGCQDVVLLERDQLTSGTTWHAAGLMVTFGSTSETSTEMRKYTRDLYARLEAETGQATGFKPVGFIEVAGDADRLQEYRRVSAFNRACGVDVQEISPSEVKQLFPLAKVDDLLAGFYVKEDGRVNPVDVTMALGKGAKLQGVQIFEGVAATGVTQASGRVTGVKTAQGDIQCDVVVNCCGMWARQFGDLAGVNIPLQSAEHYYLITEKMAGISNQWPILEDPSSYGYYREEVGGLMVGLFEPKCAPWKIEGVPQGFSFGEITPDWDRMGPYLEKAMARVPTSLNAGIKKFFCGPESFTPDLRPIVGEAPELKNYFVAAGLNSIGILTGGGLGRLLAQWILTGDPGADITGMNIDRLHRYQANPAYRRTRTVEMLGMVYRCHYPYQSPQTARGCKLSPLHSRLASQGAYFKDVSGWEGADWYAGPGQEAKVERQSWGREPWFANWQAEHQAARNDVILMDMSFMSKFRVQGRDAGKLLNWLSTNDVDGAAGQITYTQWLNERGKLEADLTVTKLGDEQYWVVATDTMHRHVETWMNRHIGDHHVFVQDVTGAYAQINVQGPKSRQLLQKLTTADLSDQAFPFRSAREIDLGFARALCVRITYLGELGYELYVAAEQAGHVYDQLLEAGPQFGLRPAGLKALGSLRMEKGYRDYGHDLDNTDDSLETGLGFCLDFNKSSGFLGREAILAKKQLGTPKRRLVQVQVLDPEPLVFHAEVLWCNGQRAGYVRSASYGWTLGGAVGLAMVEGVEPEPGSALDQKWIDKQAWELEISERRYAVRVSLRPLYDPEMAKIRA